MLKTHTCMLAAIALIFSLATAHAADPAAGNNASQPAPESKAIPTQEEMARTPSKYLRAIIRADNMGYLSAVVQNQASVPVANVFVVVVHFNEKTRQPDRQTAPLLVARKLAPMQSARVSLQGVQVFNQAEFSLYQAIVARAELAR
jgi:hypothetical protein